MQFPDFMFRDKNKIHAFGGARVLPGEIVPYSDGMKESALASSAIDFAKENGFEKIYLDSMKGYDKAIRLYRSLGFMECERYNDNDKADVFMVKELATSK